MANDLPLTATVVKVGGSLLEIKDLAARLRGLFSLLRKFGGVATVVGGGSAADLVRRWDEQQTFSDHEAHWLAIQAMRLTEGLLSIRAPECGNILYDRDEVREALLDKQPVILSIGPMLREATEDFAPHPPESWDVSSDTLAAWAARHIGAPRLVLAKSVDLPEGGLAAATEQRIVDPMFRQWSAGLELLWVNLRKDPLHLTPLESSL